MEDNSFFSGLSSIGEAIGESSYGRCVTLWITSCEPSAKSLCVRLGGPGNLWHTVSFPMTQPLTVHRLAGVRVLRRATELAIATPSYTQSPAAESEEVTRSGEMAAMDVLTNMASTAAGSIMKMTGTTSGGKEDRNHGNGDDAPEVELVAAADDTEHAPLRVRFRWAIGEILPGAPLSTEAKEEAAAQAASRESSGSKNEGPIEAEQRPHADNNSGSFENTQEPEGGEGRAEGFALLSTYHSPFDDAESAQDANSPHKEPHTPPSPALGDEESTPNSSAVDSAPFRSPSLPEAAPPHVPAVNMQHLSGLHDDSSDNSHHSDQGSAPENHPLHPSGTAAGSHSAGAADPIRTQSPITRLSTPLDVPRHPDQLHSSSADTKNPVAVSFNGSDVALQRREHSATMSTGQSSSRSNTPRRQRPLSARRSTVQIDLAPAMEDTLKAKKSPIKENATTATASAATSDVSVNISDDDEDDMPVRAMHLPPPPPPALPMQQQQQTDFAASEHAKDNQDPSHASHTPAQPSLDAAAASHALHFASSADREAPSASQWVSRPSVDNLFEGAAASELLVSVAVVAVVNTNGAADPHRVVSVGIQATTTTPEKRDSKGAGMPSSSQASAACVSFQTAPTLRSLASVVPQMSAPTLLHSLQHREKSNDGNDDHDDDEQERRRGMTDLHAVCTVSESVLTANATAVAAAAVLWTTEADVKPTDKAPLSSSAPLTQEVRFSGANGDVVVTQWTYLTVGAYRDAALNLRCRADEPGQPTLQLLFVAQGKAAGVPAHVWVSAPGSRLDAVQHRLAAAAPVHSLLLQPVHVTLQDPLGYIAVHVPQIPQQRHHSQHAANAGATATVTTTSTASAHVEPIFFPGFSEEWVCARSMLEASLKL